MKAALLVIDVQKQFFSLGEACTGSLKSAVEYINEAITLFRKKGLPIVFIQHSDDSEGLAPGNANFEVHESVDLQEKDLRIVKTTAILLRKPNWRTRCRSWALTP